MIPKIFLFKGDDIEYVLQKYKEDMPYWKKTEEEKAGPLVCVINQVLFDGRQFYLIATLYEDLNFKFQNQREKAMTEADNILKQMGPGVEQMMNVLKAQNCPHLEYEKNAEGVLACKNCGTPM